MFDSDTSPSLKKVFLSHCATSRLPMHHMPSNAWSLMQEFWTIRQSKERNALARVWNFPVLPVVKNSMSFILKTINVPLLAHYELRQICWILKKITKTQRIEFYDMSEFYYLMMKNLLNDSEKVANNCM